MKFLPVFPGPNEVRSRIYSLTVVMDSGPALAPRNDKMRKAST